MLDWAPFVCPHTHTHTHTQTHLGDISSTFVGHPVRFVVVEWLDVGELLLAHWNIDSFRRKLLQKPNNWAIESEKIHISFLSYDLSFLRNRTGMGFSWTFISI